MNIAYISFWFDTFDIFRDCITCSDIPSTQYSYSIGIGPWVKESLWGKPAEYLQISHVNSLKIDNLIPTKKLQMECILPYISCNVVIVTLFPTKIHENTHMYNTLTVVSPQNVLMYFVSGCQKKLRLIELAAATCYLQFCRATARTGPEEMTHWHPGGRFKESLSSNGFHNIYSIILSRIISRYVPFHQMSF